MSPRASLPPASTTLRPPSLRRGTIASDSGARAICTPARRQHAPPRRSCRFRRRRRQSVRCRRALDRLDRRTRDAPTASRACRSSPMAHCTCGADGDAIVAETRPAATVAPAHRGGRAVTQSPPRRRRSAESCRNSRREKRSLLIVGHLGRCARRMYLNACRHAQRERRTAGWADVLTAADAAHAFACARLSDGGFAMNRRTFVKNLAALGAAASLGARVRSAAQEPDITAARIPRWRGFNLQGRFAMPGQAGPGEGVRRVRLRHDGGVGIRLRPPAAELLGLGRPHRLVRHP